MKDKIQDIASKSCCLLSDESLEGFEQLMCNEVVKAYMVKYESFKGLYKSKKQFYDLHTEDLLERYKNDYSEQTIKTAIENYKKQIK